MLHFAFRAALDESVHEAFDRGYLLECSATTEGGNHPRCRELGVTAHKVCGSSEIRLVVHRERHRVNLVARNHTFVIGRHASAH